MKKLIVYTLVLGSFLGNAQSEYKSAEKNFESLWYMKAAEQYERIIARGDDSQKVLQRVADAYYYNTDMENASKWYGQLFSKYEKSVAPTYVFRYAHALKGIGNYDLAKSLVKVHKEKLNQGGLDVEELGYIDERLDEIRNQPPQFFISHLSINSRLADFGPMFYKDKIVFSSSRDSTNLRTRIYKWNEQPYLNLFFADTVGQGTDLMKVAAFSENINSKYHEAVVAFSADGNTLYFTRNNYTNKNLGTDADGMNHLKLYTATLTNEEWGNVQEVPFNSEDYSVGQPALSADGKQLYFVSDMPGTIGGTDIFVVDILGAGSYSSPRNVGPTINTIGREMFPFLTENKLYFASDGHAGLGGLDVFESIFDGTFSAPVNLGQPLNGQRDDFAYIVDETTQKGYFSSNREGGMGDDDIYSFQRYERHCGQDLLGQVVSNTGIPIEHVSVFVFDETEAELAQTTTDENGQYRFDIDLDCSKQYVVKTFRPGYQQKSKRFDTPGQDQFVNNVLMQLQVQNDLIVEENGQLKIKIEKIFFDFNKAEIRPDAAFELGKVVSVMQEYPDMVIDIEAHTDSRGADDYNEKLSDLRAKATRDFILSKGISPERISSAIGFGEKHLLNDCTNLMDCSDQKHDANRRSEFIIKDMHGRLADLKFEDQE